MKNKNPLYVVNGKDVQEASGVVDFLVKKLNLEPIIEMINSLIELLLSNVSSYPMFLVVKEFIDKIINKILLFKDYALI